MKLITNSKTLEMHFLRIQNEYSEYYWATAWAGVGSKPFENLRTLESKIKQIVVGIHFYQTHPDFIEQFLNNDSVKYIMQPDGTFHPKLFLFYNNDDNWELLIGSANFTNSAFTNNTEVTMIVTSKDKGAGNILWDAKKFIKAKWDKAIEFDDELLQKY